MLCWTFQNFYVRFDKRFIVLRALRIMGNVPVAMFCVPWTGKYLKLVNPIQTGGGKVPALTLNAYNFFKTHPNAAKLCKFIENLSGNKLVG